MILEPQKIFLSIVQALRLLLLHVYILNLIILKKHNLIKIFIKFCQMPPESDKAISKEYFDFLYWNLQFYGARDL